MEIVLRNSPRLAPAPVPLAEALGAVLAEPVAADMDLPPFDRSAMDGYAVRAADVARLPADLAVAADLPAGAPSARPLAPGACAKTMTGAPVPPGADLVVPVEDAEPLPGGRVRILRADPQRTNIRKRGEDVRRGQAVLEAGRLLRPEEIGVLASVGRTHAAIFRRPRVAVLATGEELVPVGAVPGPGQVRNVNSSTLLAACRAAAVPADDLGVARDDPADLRQKIAGGLTRDVLLVSGGVSMGDRDFVPSVLRDCGATVHFATVRMKPGKPTVFATRGRTLIFGLAGNPVSTLVGFRLLVRPALRRMMGHPTPAPPPIRAALAGAVRVGGDRLTFLPARLGGTPERPTAQALPFMGSGDLVGFSRADALLALEPGDYQAGATADAYPLEM